MDIKPFQVPASKKIRLADYRADFTNGYHDKQGAQEKLLNDIEKMAELQDVLYAQNQYSLLLIFQAMDAAGKDSVIKHVMSGINPQGCQVMSFKAPSQAELDHDYLWRCTKALPERGRIGIFNRSYYEEVLAVRVHPEILNHQKLPQKLKTKNIWQERFEDINAYERYLTRNGTVILKFYLNLSREEQKKRFLERINTPEKNWKFLPEDLKDRGFWQEYQKAYEDLFRHTGTEYAPWYIIPADKKWFTRMAVADIIVRTLKGLDLRHPKVAPKHLEALQAAKKKLEAEK
jgi:PPK2 family polyphosphate:nucleotide phosphotransferase